MRSFEYEADGLQHDHGHTRPPTKEEGNSRASAVLRLQRAAGNGVVGGLLEDDRSPIDGVVGSGRGEPLDDGTRQDMESRLGHDFSDVRVHRDAEATRSAQAMNAHAYTVGTDVVFQGDRYSPGTQEGKHTLAHELTHVMQQKAGPVDGTPGPGGVKVSDPSDRFEQEAERNAARAVSGDATVSSSAPAAQRQASVDDEEEEMQGSFVQRQGDLEDEEEEPAV
jgi:hypothetical protein